MLIDARGRLYSVPKVGGTRSNNREAGPMREWIHRWRGVEDPTLEVVRVRELGDEYRADSWFVSADSLPVVVHYRWVLDRTWRTRVLTIETHEPEQRRMFIERAGPASWRVDGVSRSDLDGCDEIDLSITPFSNTLGLLRFGPAPGGAGALTALYVPFPELTCIPSRQEYERLGPLTFRYVDFGANAGFRAELTVDEDGSVCRYERLFERL